MIRTFIKHYLTDYALNVMFSNLIDNLGSKPLKLTVGTKFEYLSISDNRWQIICKIGCLIDEHDEGIAVWSNDIKMHFHNYDEEYDDLLATECNFIKLGYNKFTSMDNTIDLFAHQSQMTIY